MSPLRTYVYIDGFNLYYGRLKRTKFKWLDLSRLPANLLPTYDIQQIRYFTATVSPRPTNPDVHLRQQAYLTALSTLPNVSVHLGRFLQSTPLMPLLSPPAGGPNHVRVLKTEEKGSDVALASHLVADGCFGRYDLAVVLSNDSDLVPPIEIVRNELQLSVGVLNPHKNTSHALRQAASFYRPVREGVVRASQFPDNIQLVDGRIISRPLR